MKEITGNYPYGENIFAMKAMKTPSEDDMATAAVSDWNNYEYDFTMAKLSEDSGKYTQLLWASSQHVGCAYAVRERHYYFVVCLYNPTGNQGNAQTIERNVNDRYKCEPPTIYKGRVKYQGPYHLGQPIHIECEGSGKNNSYQLVGSRKGTCSCNKTFVFEEPPRCTGCEVIGIENGTSNYTPGSVIPHEQYVTYTCNDGYSSDSAPRVLKCEGNNFDHPLPRCRKEGHCLRPNIEKGVAYASPLDDSFVPRFLNDGGWEQNIPEGNTVTITCQQQGYELVGNGTAKCLGKQYDRPLGTCKPCYIRDVRSIYSRYINVYTGLVYDRPFTCFGPNTQGLVSNAILLKYPPISLLLLSLLFSFSSSVVT